MRYLLMVCLLGSNAVMAQMVKGRVVEFYSNHPLSNASVKDVGTDIGTVTEADGRFSINAPSDGQLEISYVGYEAQRVAINNQTELLISLVNLSSSL
ncbi:MAG: carboxypeptidase-like regulatory domain-containing protein [Flavisolibacter sp.]